MFTRFRFTALMAAGLAFAMATALSQTARADDTGTKLVRQGRFVWYAPSAHKEKALPVSPRGHEPQNFIYDKGPLGKYERHGRTVTKVPNIPPRPAAAKTDYDAGHSRVVDHYKHKHFMP